MSTYSICLHTYQRYIGKTIPVFALTYVFIEKYEKHPYILVKKKKLFFFVCFFFQSYDFALGLAVLKERLLCCVLRVFIT